MQHGSNQLPVRCPAQMISARLIGRCWGGRTFLVSCGDQVSTIKYTPWGWESESVSVDGIVRVRRTGRKMSHGYRFMIGESLAALSVAVPWWAETFPLSDLNFVRLEVDGHVLYEEGHPPERPLRWTVAVEGFPVIQQSLRRNLGA